MAHNMVFAIVGQTEAIEIWEFYLAFFAKAGLNAN
jgi:hypothetical protein